MFCKDPKFTWPMLMAAARRVVEADNYVKKGNLTVALHPEMLTGRDIHGALGVGGARRIGRAVARRAKGFNMKILYFSRSAKPNMERTLGAKRV